MSAYPRNTQGTTMDGVLDALLALIDILTKVYSAQLQTVGAGTDGNAMTAEVAAKLDAVKAAVAAGNTAASNAATAAATREQALLAELVKHSATLATIAARLEKGLLVKTVVSL